MKIRFIILFLIACNNIQVKAEDLDHSDSAFILNYQEIKMAQWQEVIASYKGNILVVDMWATWCSSCLKRFPHMVEMNKKYADKNVKFISLLLEDPEEADAIANAKKFLIKQKANFDHYFMNENLMHSFEELDLLGIPTVFIYSQKSELAYRLTGDNPNKQFTEIDIENAINELIKDSNTIN